MTAVQKEDLVRLNAWFDTYTKSFLTGDADADGPLILKIDHTQRVCANIRRLARTMGIDERGLNLAEAVGRFHDVGRFEQFRQYGTFNDRQSVNHAVLGVDIMKAAGILLTLEAGERAILVDAVRFHNVHRLPKDRPRQSMLFIRLIRDADKLDIWKVFADYYRQTRHPVSAIIQHLPDRPTWSPSIVEAILEKRMAVFGEMKSLNDFKLLQLSWVFDLQFDETRVLARERGDLAVIAGTLPDDDDVARAVACVMQQLAEPARLTDQKGRNP